MGKPLFKASDGGRIDILGGRENATQSEFPQGSGTWAFLPKKVRPESLTRQRIIFVMTGISPKGSTDRFTHVRIAWFSAISCYILIYQLPICFSYFSAFASTARA